MLTRRSLLALAALTPVGALMAPSVMAATPETFADDGLAIRGIDPVAYFAGNGPVAGSPDHQLMWKGAIWQFASAPGYTASPDPESWTLHAGKLYLNYSISVRAQWRPEIAENIALADANWPKVLEA